MKKRVLAMLLVMSLATASLVGCGSSDTSEGTDSSSSESTEDTSTEDSADASTEKKSMSFNISQEPTTLDPTYNAGTANTIVLTHLYEGLLVENSDGTYSEASAESYEVSEDGTVYTFHLRETYWSDGVQVTAYDYEFSWNRAIDPEVASSYAWIFDSGAIESFQALDDMTFEVTLEYSNSIFLTLLGNSQFFPLREDIVDYTSGSWATDPSRVVTNGAFVMTEYTAGDRLVMEPNEYYYDSEHVYLDEIIGLMIVDSTTALTAYEAGELDALFVIPSAEKQRLLTEDPNFIITAKNGTNYYAFNTLVEPFDDIRVRQALTYAIDRTAIANDVIKGGEMPATSLVASTIYEDDGSIYNEYTDFGIPTDLSKLEEAQELLAEAGYPDGEGFPTVELLYNTDDTNKAVAEALQQQWKENLGIDVELVNMESSVFHSTRVAHDFEITKGGWNGDYNNPLTHLELYVEGNDFNYASFADDEYEALLYAAQTSDGAESFELFHEAEQILMDSYAYMPVTYSVNTFLINQDKLEGFEVFTSGVFNFVHADIIE